MKRPPKKDSAKARELPSAAVLRAFIKEQPGRVGKREIAKAFGIGPEQKPALRDLLKQLESEGALAAAGAKRFRDPDALGETVLVEITGIDRHGEALARPVIWQGKGQKPIIFMAPEQRGQAALAPGARVLARLRRIDDGKYEGRTVKRVADRAGNAGGGTIIGVYHASGAAGRIEPTDRKSKAEWHIPPGESGGALDGEVVRAEPLPGVHHGLKPARVIERIGFLGDAKTISLIAIATHDIPVDFSEAALAEAARAKITTLGKRVDLRDVPLITIDGADARDFDDAVFATPDGNGFRLIVAIADVAHYVRPGSALEADGRSRGNSAYFPDRVVPMLPEALSNGWCSLKPNEDRGCLFVDMHIAADGRKTSHRFGRGLMRSFARMTYEAIQDAHDAGSEADLPAGTVANLYAAFKSLKSARDARGTLDLDLPERKVTLDSAGHVLKVEPRPRLDSHKLIEEFMILANVAAAEELEKRHQPCMYRVHAPPSPEKLENLRGFLATLGIKLAISDQLHPRDLDQVLKLVAGTDQVALVNETMLRSQSQAEYSAENIGHFGLALTAYAHFTSPIRRYADLLVHRALISGLGLGSDGLSDADRAGFEDIAAHITQTERRAAMAERDATERYLSAFLADKIGEIFAARISGVTRFGLFVTLAESGASGFVPVAMLGDDFWVHDEATQTLFGRRSRQNYALAQTVTALLVEAKPVTGGLVFRLVAADDDSPLSNESQRPPRFAGKSRDGARFGTPKAGEHKAGKAKVSKHRGKRPR
jgi:ribonuclease R